MTAPVIPAGLWQRSAAWTLDAAVLGPLALLLAWPFLAPRAATLAQQMDELLASYGHAMGRAMIDGVPLSSLALALMQDPVLRQNAAGLETVLWSLLWPPVLWFAGLSALYHAGFECGPSRATPGQRLLGLHVTDAQRQRVGVGRALLRHFSGVASWLTLNLGHAMAAVPPSHLALHDRISGTRVSADTARIPSWAIAWLALLATVQLALIAWWMADAMATMEFALEQSLY